MALSLRSQSDPQLPPLSVMTLMNQSALNYTTHRQKKISILVLCRGCRMHYNPCQYLQCVGNAGIWRLLSVVGDNPAVRERRGSFQARIFTKQDDYVRNRLWRSQRGKSHPQTHTSHQRDTYFAVDSSSYFVFKSKSSA